jgi:2-keto-4-pentenoate hydratase/2-oxohepta-3-ene-1,7-dioic acid hydratase in catechol pathway
MGKRVKALSFELNGRPSYGIMQDGGVREASKDFRARYPDLRSVLAGDALASISENLCDTIHKAEELRFLPLIPNPDKIICVGVNYRPHVEEMGREIPEKPVLFVRFAASLVGHRTPIVKPRVSDHYDFEGELAIVIGRPARHIDREHALDYIAGYACFMDGSVRDWQRHTHQFTPGKNFDRSGALGPSLLTADEMPNPGSLVLTTRVNGRVMQEGNVDDLIFDIPTLIEYCSTFAELLPGDIIATGTPGGVGAARKPPIWLKAGDSVEVDIGPVGCLRNTVSDE